MVLWWLPYPKGRNQDWACSSGAQEATPRFDRRIFNTSVGAPLTDTACLDRCTRWCVMEWICLVIFISWSHAGLTCVECCKDIRVLLYSDGQRKHTAELTSLCALHRRLEKDTGGATSFIRIEWEISYNSSFYRHPERLCVKHWLIAKVVGNHLVASTPTIDMGRVRTYPRRRALSFFHQRCIFDHKVYSIERRQLINRGTS